MIGPGGDCGGLIGDNVAIVNGKIVKALDHIGPYVIDVIAVTMWNS